MKEQFVFAVYERIEEANRAVDELIRSGIPNSAISIYANDDVVDEADRMATRVDVEELDDNTEGRSLWERITDLFSPDTEVNRGVDLTTYQDDIDRGAILVVVQSDFEAEALRIDRDVITSPAVDEPIGDFNEHEKAIAGNDPAPQEVDLGSARQTEPPEHDRDVMIEDVYSTKLDDIDQSAQELPGEDPGDRNVEDSARAAEEADPNDTDSDYEPHHIDPANEEPQPDSQVDNLGRPVDIEEQPRGPVNRGDQDYYNRGENANREYTRQNEEKFRGIPDVKRPVTQPRKKTLNKVEQDMSNRRKTPPSDEPGVNPPKVD